MPSSFISNAPCRSRSNRTNSGNGNSRVNKRQVVAGQREERDQVVLGDPVRPATQPRELDVGQETNRPEARYPRRSRSDKASWSYRAHRPQGDPPAGTGDLGGQRIERADLMSQAGRQLAQGRDGIRPRSSAAPWLPR
jgi:hypothetical protein